MKNTKVVKAILFVCGIIFLIAGSFALFNPIGFTTRNGIEIMGNISLLNDYRGMGGLMFGSGLIIFSGVFIPRMAFTSSVVAAIVYLTFSLGRVLSIVSDGLPFEGLIKATVVELILGLLGLFLLVKYREN